MDKIVQDMSFRNETKGTVRFEVEEKDMAGNEPITNVYIKKFAARNGGGQPPKRIRVTIEPID